MSWMEFIGLEIFVSIGILSGVIGLYQNGFSILKNAIKSGKLQARGNVWTRDKNPLWFWGGVIFWFFLLIFVFLILPSISLFIAYRFLGA
jgi:hypothetical protein